jgi:hypothetical protein
LKSNLPIVVDLDDTAREVAAALNDSNAQPIRGTWAEAQPDTADDVDEDDTWCLA